ncbi:TonB-dependent receptor plug domain-containing protein [Hyphococcus sp.]|uniref:TonB-dependent receptor plug domain-containing protein n=1 Tax=Hyphococcus sp. TaxID=2038636 RepID=UPI003CCBE9F0
MTSSVHRIRMRYFKAGASATALATAALIGGAFSSAYAAQGLQEVNEQEASSGDDQIVVTGTRVSRSGFQAPTPLSVLGEDEINASAPQNIADLANELPSVVGSNIPQNSNLSFSSGGAGINSLNLRGLGGTRTLVLFDGRRSVGSLNTGAVDINEFPQPLIERIEVVTGGASAAYGSDALSGVVNFILDKDFVGVKGELSGGVTTYGDDLSWKANLTAGTEFADGRGHFLISAEATANEGIYGVPRDWNDQGRIRMINPNYTPTNGQPEWLQLENVGLSSATLGGIITNTDLRGTAFGANGAPYQFNYGSLVQDPYMQGGDWRSTQVNDATSLNPEQQRQSIFARVSYEIADDVEVFAQYSYANSGNIAWALRQFNIGNLVIKDDNPFIPDSVATRMATLGITEFRLGTNNGDLPIIFSDFKRDANRYLVGANGETGLFGTSWTWDVYAQRGVVNTRESGLFVHKKDNFAMALDAVRDPVSGSIVCRSTLTDPNNGCVPYNPMGIGVNSQAALDWLFPGDTQALREQQFTQDVIAGTFQGEPLSNWAGPISIAAGIEHRREEVEGSTDPVSQVNGWFAGNYLPTEGSYNVTEGFFETVIPIANDQWGIDQFDLNGAVRATNYSSSGYVTTWKVGATLQPIEDIRFRATRSRDIRAPNLGELFEAGRANTNNVTDPFNGNTNTQYQGLATGNLNLTPEIADTIGVGVILQPRFIPGFTASVDYYRIDIDDAIGTVGAQFIVDRCFEGDQSFCDAITRGPGPGGADVILQIRTQPFNFVTEKARGLDFEATYVTDLDDVFGGVGGSISLRAFATHYLKNLTDNGIDPPFDSVGENDGNGPPDWTYRASATYTNDALTVNLTGRGLSSGVYDNDWIECTSGCPTSNSIARTTNNNQIDGALYFDASVAYKLLLGNSEAEVFLSVRNLTNKDPAVVAPGPTGLAFAVPPTNPTLYDQLGRVFRAGLRFQM